MILQVVLRAVQVIISILLQLVLVCNAAMGVEGRLEG